MYVTERLNYVITAAETFVCSLMNMQKIVFWLCNGDSRQDLVLFAYESCTYFDIPPAMQNIFKDDGIQ